jgi:hypothetical protein
MLAIHKPAVTLAEGIRRALAVQLLTEPVR